MSDKPVPEVSKELIKWAAARLLLREENKQLSRLRFEILKSLRVFHVYQPIPWLGFEEAIRGEDTEARWQAIETEVNKLETNGTAIDLGAQLGYFCLRLAERNWMCMAVERDVRTHRAAQLIKKATGITGISHRNMEVNPDNVEELPTVDVTIFLSVWHHICAAHGFDSAKKLLTRVLRQTNKICFFETGQSNESYTPGTDWIHKIPDMEPNATEWISALLEECGASKVKALGEFNTPHLSSTPRTLFAAYTG